MLSIGDIIDKLVIENIKIFTIRDRLHSEGLTDEEHVKLFNRMNGINKNRALLMSALDDKIDRVLSGEEKNVVLRMFRTY